MNEALSRLLRQEDTVLFIGSGLSAWSKLPSWAGLLEKIADHLDGLGQDTTEMRRHIAADPVRAADYALGPGRMAPESLGRFLREDCQFGAAQPHDIHHRIVTLGARCFVTTNYDHLLESALRAEYPGRPPLVVKNNQPIEIAEIIGARSQNFVYKLHGDIDDSASLILARTQYRDLFENGDRKYALEALRTLSQTRPVVYLGFGLRDLDFLLVQDELRNLWKGAPREHYAILPDASPTDVADWLYNYGIRVVPYATVERADGSRDHAALLALLDELRVPAAPATAPVAGASPDSSATRLVLLRYANGLADVPAVSPELPLRVHASQRHRDEAYRYDSAMLQQFLDEGPERAVLIGLPGAGKTYALRQAAARAARRLREADQADAFDAATVVPLLADFKNYEGSLQQLLEKNLPGSLSLAELAGSFRLLILLDSFNEMPREQWERETHEADVAAFLKQFPTARIIISSRTEEGLSKLNLPIFTIDEIEEAFLREELQRRALDLSGRFATELFALLGKPFFFQLVARNKVTLPAEPRPRDIYESYFKALTARFTDRFGVTFDLVRALCSAAYEAINNGQEAMPAETLAQALRRNLQGAGLTTLTPNEVLNWLISEDVLLTYSGRRVAFFHQSVTEYLAATELARRYIDNNQMLYGKLSYTRWDQALFLTLSILPRKEAATFINQVVKSDFDLAVRATKYLEVGRDAIVTKLLKFVLKEIATGSDDFLSFEELPFSSCHEKYLRALLTSDNYWAPSQAASGLLEACGYAVKDEMVDFLFADPTDDNIGYDLGLVLQYYTSLEELLPLISRLEKEYVEFLNNNDEDDSFEVASAIGLMLTCVSVEDCATALLDTKRQVATMPVRASALQTRLERHLEEEGDVQTVMAIALRMLSLGLINGASIMSMYDWTELNPSCFQTDHVRELVRMVTRGDGFVALRAIRVVCKMRPDLSVVVEQECRELTGLERAFAIAASDEVQRNQIFDILQQSLKMSSQERQDLRTDLLIGTRLDWTGYEELFTQLMRLEDWEFVESLLAGSYMSGEASLNLNPLDEWLAWLVKACKNAGPSNQMLSWYAKQLFSRNEKCQGGLLAEFNRVDSPYREVLMDVLADLEWTTDDFSDETQDYLLQRLMQYHKEYHGRSLLGQTVTEAFVIERLLPLRNTDNKVVKENVANILEEAGARHRRRYLLPTAVA